MSLENTLREMLSEGSEIKPAPKQTPKSKESEEKALIKSTLHAEEKPNPTRSASGPGVDYTPKRSIKEFYKARLEGALLGESPISALSGLLLGTGSLGSAGRAVARHMAPASSSSASSAPYQSDDMESRRTQPGYGTNLPAGSQASFQPPRLLKSRIMGGLLALGRAAQRKASALVSESEAHETTALEGARREGRLDRIAAGILAGGVAAGGFGVGNLAAGSLIPTDVATHNAEVAAGEVVPPPGVSIKGVMDTAKPSPAYGAFQRGAIAAREAARAKGKKGK
jgi:hypothetical protein